MLVLGAAGKFGLHLCLMLQRAFDLAGRSERVVAVSRFTSLRDTEAFSRHGLQTIRCDLAEPAELARLLSGQAGC